MDKTKTLAMLAGVAVMSTLIATPGMVFADSLSNTATINSGSVTSQSNQIGNSQVAVIESHNKQKLTISGNIRSQGSADSGDASGGQGGQGGPGGSGVGSVFDGSGTGSQGGTGGAGSQSGSGGSVDNSVSQKNVVKNQVTQSQSTSASNVHLSSSSTSIHQCTSQLLSFFC